MANLNKIQIIGNLGRDPETRTFDNGDQVANTSIAVTERWKDKTTGEQREHTEWINLTFTQRLAEIASQYLRKGSSIYVEGRLRTRKWQDQSGQDRYTTEVRVDQMQMLGGRPEGGQDQTPRQAPPQGQAPRQAAPRPAGAPPRQAPRQQDGGRSWGGGGFEDMESGDTPFANPLHSRALCLAL